MNFIQLLSNFYNAKIIEMTFLSTLNSSIASYFKSQFLFEGWIWINVLILE